MGSAGTLRQALERLALAGALAAALGALWLIYRVSPGGAFFLLLLTTALPAAAYVVWHAHPAAVLSAGIGLSIFSGSWKYMGFPELVAPDRLLIAAAIVTVIARAPQVRDRPPIQIGPIHWLAAATVAYIVASALAAGTFFDKAALLRLTDRIGIVGFLLFTLAPVIFAKAQHRSMLLGCLVAVGLYLAVTSFFEALGAHRARLSALYIGPSNRHPRRPRARAVPRGRRQWHGDLHRPRGRSRGRTNVAWALAAQCGERDRSPLRRLARVHAHPIGVGGFRCGDRGHDARSPTAQTMAAAGRRRRCPHDRRNDRRRPRARRERADSRIESGSHLGPAESLSGRAQHGGGEAVGRLRMGPLQSRRNRLFPAGRLPPYRGSWRQVHSAYLSNWQSSGWRARHCGCSARFWPCGWPSGVEGPRSSIHGATD